MGLENKVCRLLIQGSTKVVRVAQNIWQRSPEEFNQLEATFKAELDTILTPERYTQELLRQTVLKNATFGQAFNQESKKNLDKLFNEVHEACVLRLDMQEHSEKFTPNIYVFIYGYHQRAAYVDGILTDLIDSQTSDQNARWLAHCMKKGGLNIIEVEPSDTLQDYLEKHDEKFPKWLQDVDCIQEPQYFPKV